MEKLSRLIAVGLPIGIEHKHTIRSVDDVRIIFINGLLNYRGQALHKHTLFGNTIFRVPQNVHDQISAIADQQGLTIKEVSAALMMEVL